MRIWNWLRPKQMHNNTDVDQASICRKYHADFQPVDPQQKLGVSANFFSGSMPLNGLRLPSENNTCGWYLWAGEELSQADDFFQPMHVYHVTERYPQIVQYLGLPPGWRFLTDGVYEDVRFDEQLLQNSFQK